MVCVRCKKRKAVVFIQRMDGGKPVQEGYCLTCAREMHIQPVDDLMKQFGMSDQDLENMEERMSSFLQEAADSGMLPTAAGEDAKDRIWAKLADENIFDQIGRASCRERV